MLPVRRLTSGVTLFELASGVYPFPTPSADMFDSLSEKPHSSTAGNSNLSIFQICDHIIQDEPPQVPEGLVSDELANFIARCLTKDQKKRANIQDLFSHEFMVAAPQKCDTDFNYEVWLQAISHV